MFSKPEQSAPFLQLTGAVREAQAAVSTGMQAGLPHHHCSMMAIPGSCIAPCAYLLEQFITFALTITNDSAYQRGAKIYMSIWKAQEQAFSTHSSSPAGWER